MPAPRSSRSSERGSNRAESDRRLVTAAVYPPLPPDCLWSARQELTLAFGTAQR
eukprot:COSAG01_NODE_68480_length_264_cov_0.612121_1_plen_53_part_01